ncbi:GroES-like protein [Thozetella sp. PMI_491]|nr:GroES-like protein [Thozetella sp. PMI_491]
MSHSQQEVPPTMKAWTYTRVGLPSRTIKLAQVPVPTLTTPTSVLVRVSHVALHPGTSLMAQIVPFLFRKTPAVAETDFSGTIVAVGEKVVTESSSGGRELPVGTPVFGTIAVPAHIGKGAGSLAEYLAVESAHIAVKPDAVPFDVASACAVSAATALVLLDAAELKPGAQVLVNSCCGGIGNIATQLARKAVGPEGKIVGVCSASNEELAKQLGCDEVVAYDQLPDNSSLPDYIATKYGLETEIKGFDCIMDAFGSQLLWHNSARYLKAGSQHPYASVGVHAPVTVKFGAMLWSIWGMISNNFWPVWLGGVPRKNTQISMFVDDKTMNRVKTELEAGSFRPHIGGSWKFEDAKQAYVEYLRGHAKGKLVVEVADSQ